ncbi:hypothetical protein PC116_g31276 [Phytophthora cactorum]|nr:hypothetical protein PC116_g31276 [Phytophthora cactorum]
MEMTVLLSACAVARDENQNLGIYTYAVPDIRKEA